MVFTRLKVWSGKEKYLSVENQVESLHVPDEQEINVYALVSFENNLFKNFENDGYKSVDELKAFLMDNYTHEDDHGTYILMCNGREVVCQNFRALAGAKKSVEKDGRVLLAHKFGSRLDFSLVDHLGVPQDEIWKRD